jgi:hypothetical protein
MPTPVTVTRSSNILQAWIDGQILTFDGNGQATGQGTPGNNSLTWVVLGGANSTYTIAITSPGSAVFSHTGTLDSSMKDAGVHWFSI